MSRSGTILAVFLAVLVVTLAPRPATAGPTLVFDVETGTVLHADGAGKPWYPASLTKLMTSYVVFHAIKDGRLSLETKIIYSKNAQLEPASKIGLPVGSKLTVDWALQALLVRSANDIAVALAEAVGGTENNFVRMMNEQARRLAMTGTYFSNPHGLPDRRNITTARDMGLLARAIIREFPQYQRYFEADYVRHGRRNLKNRNSSFLHISEYSDGMKTGFICNSGFNVVASQTKDGRRLVAVVLGAKSSGVRSVTANTLLQEAFDKKPGGLLSQPRKLIELTNGGLFARYPTDMAKVVCRRMGNVRITAPNVVRGWSVVLARETNATDAQEFLDKELKPLKSVVYGGRAAVVRMPDRSGYAAMIYRLDANQSKTVCSHLKADGAPCEVLDPEVFKDVVAKYEEEERQRRLTQKSKKRTYAKPNRKRVIRNAPKQETTKSASPLFKPQGSVSLR